MTDKEKEQVKLLWNELKKPGTLFFGIPKGKYSSTQICDYEITDDEFKEIKETIIDNFEPVEINIIQKREFTIDVLNTDENINKLLSLINKGIIDEATLINEHSIRLKKTTEYKQKCYENNDFCIGSFEV